ncbi:purine-cytosine permease family protein [Amycolatopsis jejuensis]|uniref:purine-cytosine permease family protein n=1 Tax=Amycolatopsis jejuensis TaxID=330084 RepID=UPI0005260AE7|nr:permease [Amycolatopsis jejuensis]
MPISQKPAPLDVSFADDPRVVRAAATEDYSTHVVPRSWRSGRWSLASAWWALFSAMFWLYLAVASADAVGTPNTLVAMALSVATYGGINLVLSRYAAKTGLTVALLSRRLFGLLGSALAPLILAATAIYYGVFEGSIVATAFQKYFGGDLRLWYLAVVLYALPLVIGGVRMWLDKLNGILLPFYAVGLVAVVVAATVKQGYPGNWLSSATSASPLPGWLTAYLIYMGVWIMMMYTVDYARFGKERDASFHGTVTFGWVFYFFTFAINGVVGIYLLRAWHIAGSETGVVDAFVNSLGFAGVLVIFVSQTRINTANYYLASTNLEAFAARVFRIRPPRIVWVLVAGVIAYLFMLTDVLSYLLIALAWQGVFVTAWIAIALVHIATHRTGQPEFRPGRLRPLTAGAGVWVVASAIGIVLTVQNSVAVLSQLAPLVTVALAAAGYYLAVRFGRTPVLARGDDPRTEVDDPWEARIRCHACDLSYIAVEMDRDPAAGGAAICSACAAESPGMLRAAREEARMTGDGQS